MRKYFGGSTSKFWILAGALAIVERVTSAASTNAIQYINEGSLHENPFEVVEEDVAEAAPSFNIIEEDNVDDDIQ